MKKQLVALAVTAAMTGGVHAAQVSLSGTLDVGVMVQHLDHKTTTSMESGMNEFSCIDLRTSENVNSDLKVGLYLSQALTVDNGMLDTENRLFDLVELSVQTTWGDVFAGRLGSLKGPDGDMSLFSAVQGFSPMGSNLPNTGLAGIMTSDGILNNAIGYRSPVFHGHRLSLQYSNGVSTEVGQAAKDDRHLTAGLAYNNGGRLRYGVIMSYRTHNTVSADQKASKDITASFNYDFDAFRLYVTYQHAWDGLGPNTFLKASAFGFDSDTKGFKTDALMIGAAIPVWGGTLSTVVQGSHSKYDGQVKAGQVDSGWRINPGAIYRYPLSKRTTLWASASWSHGWQMYKQVKGGMYAEPNTTTWGAGITYTF